MPAGADETAPRGFKGLGPEGIAFLAALRWNNNKPFFEENRAVYERCLKQPLEALAKDLAPAMQRIDSGLDVRPARVVSRIYRDARRSRGIPYRDHLWLSWHPANREKGSAFSFYYFVDIEQCGWGMGVYMPRPGAMKALREKMITKRPVFEAILAAPVYREFSLGGEDYRRPPESRDGGPLLAPWLMKKSFYLEKCLPVEASFDPELSLRLERDFLALAPLYQFIAEVDNG